MFFPVGTITSGDVVAALPDIIDSLRNTYQADMEGLDYESEVEMTTLGLLDGFAEMPRRQTFADKKESELKQRIKEVRAEEKEKFEKRVEKVIEKDNNRQTETVTESDSQGGTRTTSNLSHEESTIYEDRSDNTKSPYVSKTIAPQVEGVVVIASGGDNALVKENITEAVRALFDIDTHKIRIMKRSDSK